jgi:Flp pilus assembly protein TadG
VDDQARLHSRSARYRRTGTRRHSGQSLVEFALLAPIFFFVLLGTVDGGLLLYSKGSIDHAADVGFTSLAALGNCVSVPNCPSSDADQVAIARMRTAGLGSPALAKIDYITVSLMVQHSDGSIQAAVSGDPQYINECTALPCANRYLLDGSSLMSNWTIANRSVTNGSADFVKLDIKYEYQYFAVDQPTLTITVTKVFRLEPQT